MRRVTNTIISSELIFLKWEFPSKKWKYPKKECNVVAFWKQFYKLCMYDVFVYIHIYCKRYDGIVKLFIFFPLMIFLAKTCQQKCNLEHFFHISKKYKDLEFFRKIGCFIWRAANLIKSNKYIFQSIWKKYFNNFLSNLLLHIIIIIRR